MICNVIAVERKITKKLNKEIYSTLQINKNGTLKDVQVTCRNAEKENRGMKKKEQTENKNKMSYLALA